MPSDDLPGVRPSDADRDAAVQTLQVAVGEGRLTLDEFGDRTSLALAADSKDVLEGLTADLPQAVTTPVGTNRRSKWIFGIFGGDDRSGRWRLPPKCRVVNFMGGADLDLRSATISAPICDITIVSIMGGSDILVPDGVEVDLGGFSLFGGSDLQAASTPIPPGAPLLRIRAFSFMGGTDIKRGD